MSWHEACIFLMQSAKSPPIGLKRDHRMQDTKNNILPLYGDECCHTGGLHYSFAGGAILSFFNVGIARWMIRNLDRTQIQKVHGVSGGALCAAWLLSSKDSRSFGYVTEQYLSEWKAKIRRLGGPLALRRSLSYHRSLLVRYLPEDAHISCSGRLSIALTNVRTRKQEYVSQFRTRQELIDYLIASMTIPFVNAVLPSKVNGERYVDGGFISNEVICCENVTLCSPFPQLFAPFQKHTAQPNQSILGMNPLINAFNPNSDVRMQFELGYNTAKKYYANPAVQTPKKITPPSNKKPKLSAAPLRIVISGQ